MKRIIFLTALIWFSSGIAGAFPKDCYLDIMQAAFEAYAPERLEDYISRVENEGISEHGFGRVTSNLGILIAHGRLSDRKDLFVRMMDLTARETPLAHQKNGHRRNVGNDFSVKEICNCIEEIEKTGAFPAEKIAQWRAPLSAMVAEQIYSCQPEMGDPVSHNWAVYGSASESARVYSGMGGDRAYPDRHFADQCRFFDANGMYVDPGAPMVYDLVTRLQFMSALDYGYDGPARDTIVANLLKSAEPTLLMQSATGEIPYGGRSNQFLHNDTFYAAVCEYYARWFKQMGNMAMASRFKAAAERSVASIRYWMEMKPVRHVKNRYPTETSYGCEDYAYFDKYMITTASWAYLAYRFADDSIPASTRPEKASTLVMGPDFHRIVMNSGGYTVQLDLDAQKTYDSNGIGRFQKCGASPIVALASPCADVKKPNFKLDIVNDGPLAISPLWEKYEIVRTRPGLVVLTDGSSVWRIRLSRRGVRMTLRGRGKQMVTLPAFIFDGETESVVSGDDRTLKVSFKGSCCEWRTNGSITDTEKIYGNRNGHLRRYDVAASNKLIIRGKISTNE